MPPPDRWEEYCGVKNVIEGTRLVCFKVPLKDALQSKIEDDKKFSPKILIAQLKENARGLGMVIDLTFTKRYYNETEFTNKGIQYEKIFTKGKEVPSDHVFGKFAHVIDSFLETNKDNKLLIGIHCTHGVNRTGYLVCRYMIERFSWEPDVAISNFNESRGHPLERVNYIEDLKSRKPGEITPFDPLAPMPKEDTPEWQNRHSKYLEYDDGMGEVSSWEGRRDGFGRQDGYRDDDFQGNQWKRRRDDWSNGYDGGRGGNQVFSDDFDESQPGWGGHGSFGGNWGGNSHSRGGFHNGHVNFEEGRSDWSRNNDRQGIWNNNNWGSNGNGNWGYYNQRDNWGSNRHDNRDQLPWGRGSEHRGQGHHKTGKASEDFTSDQLEPDFNFSNDAPSIRVTNNIVQKFQSENAGREDLRVTLNKFRSPLAGGDTIDRTQFEKSGWGSGKQRSRGRGRDWAQNRGQGHPKGNGAKV